MADLNTISREEVRRILEEGGETIPEAPKTRRTYNTKRGAEIEERLRKGQSVDHIARNMGMTERGVMAWIRSHGKEEMLEGVRDEPLPPEEEARRMEEKRKRMIWEKKKEEQMKKMEGGAEAAGSGAGKEILPKDQHGGERHHESGADHHRRGSGGIMRGDQGQGFFSVRGAVPGVAHGRIKSCGKLKGEQR